MRKLIYSSMVSLDGFVARPNGDLDPRLETSLDLRLVETRPFQSGVVYLRYLKE